MIKIKITFREFKSFLKNNVIQFEKGEQWDTEEWNEAYADFKELSNTVWDETYIRDTEPEILAQEWAMKYCGGASKETHSYWINPEFIAKREIEKTIHVDPLHEAEKITGESYKNSENTGFLGLAMQMEKSAKMETLMSDTDDTKFSETEEEYLRKVKDFGFESVLIVPFTNKEKIEERLHILFHPEYSILLKFDTYSFGDDGSFENGVPPPSVNGGSFYYNWVPNKDYKGHVTSSGGYIGHDNNGCSDFSSFFNRTNFTPNNLPKKLADEKPNYKELKWTEYLKQNKAWEKKCAKHFAKKDVCHIYSGNHDCREALKFNINRMLKQGSFLKKWKERPFLWLLHHAEENTDNHSEVNEKYIAMLPKKIQNAIKGK